MRLSLLLAFGFLVFSTGHSEIITVDDDGGGDFLTIQEAIDYSWHGDTIIVNPGEYVGDLDFSGRKITLRSTNPDDYQIRDSTTINGRIKFMLNENNESVFEGLTTTAPDGFYISFAKPQIKKCNIYGKIYIGEGGGCILQNNIIRANNGVYISNSYYGSECIIKNNHIEGPGHSSDTGIEIRAEFGTIKILNNIIQSYDSGIFNNPDYSGAQIIIDYNCFWNNKYHVVSIISGDNNIVNYPELADDFHLKSEFGRWDSQTGQWVIDDVTSRCIDAGDPADDIEQEPNPNGGRINIGPYGGTAYASKSSSEGPDPQPECINPPEFDNNNDCKVNLQDFINLSSQWLNCGYSDPNACI